MEARWYHSGHTPRLEEYLDNACVSIAAPVILMHLKFLTSVSSKEEILKGMESAENIVRYTSLILRLADDLGTSSVIIIFLTFFFHSWHFGLKSHSVEYNFSTLSVFSLLKSILTE